MKAMLNWWVIEKAARDLGVKPKALEKWRHRGHVPHKWRLAIIRWSDGQIPLDAFERPIPLPESRDAR